MYTKSQDLSLIEAVRNAVFEAGPDPTVPLTEQRLAERFGRSRTPVRDVLRELEHDGIIERRQRRGIRLRRPSPRELAEVYDLRTLLEGHAARLAVEHASPADVRQLRGHARRFATARRSGDEAACEQANIAFHGKFVELAGNELLRRMMDRFNIIRRAFWMTHSLRLDERDTTTPYPHEAILERLEARDPDGCERLMKAHIERARNFLIEKALDVRLAPAAGVSADTGAAT